MAYATLQDLVDRVGADTVRQLTDRIDLDAGEIDAEAVDQALGDATATIDGHVAARYRVPLEPVPGMIRRIACDLARYYLMSGGSRGVDKDTERDWEAALRTLRDIASGSLTLQVAGIQAQTGGPAVLHTAPDRVFTAQTLKGL